MPFTEDQDMIQTVAPECPDQALSIGVLPGRTSVRSGGRESPSPGLDS